MFTKENPGPGRPKGSTNATTKMQRAFAERVCYGQDGANKTEFEQWVRAELFGGRLPGTVVSLILFYLLGKPVERVELDVRDKRDMDGLSKDELMARARELLVEAEQLPTTPIDRVN